MEASRTGRVIALVVGCLLVLPGLGALIGGGTLAGAYALARDDDGFFDADLDRVSTGGVAITTEDLTFAADPGSPDWVLDAVDVDARLRVTSAGGERPVFVGIGPVAEVRRYLRGSAYDVITDVRGTYAPEYRSKPGDLDIAPPGEQAFWVASASGRGTQEVVWEFTSGKWAAVVMHADGSPGVAADVNVGIKADILLPLALSLVGVGLVVTVVAVALIVAGARGLRGLEPTEAAVPRPAPSGDTPVALHAELDPDLSSWKWLVKWILAIPHVVVLVFLWIAFAVLTVVAGFSILFTGRYPRAIFDFNLGVLRWSWRVSYYAFHGGLGTDRYPPFSLAAEADYPARLDVAYPERLSRGLVLVKWWLLAIPHYVIVGVLMGGAYDTDGAGRGGGSPGLLPVLVFIAGVILLVRGRYLRSLFDLIIGLNRWVYRVVAYGALMTDQYPPFRLDQGGSEPASAVATDPPLPPAPAPPPSA